MSPMKGERARRVCYIAQTKTMRYGLKGSKLEHEKGTLEE